MPDDLESPDSPQQVSALPPSGEGQDGDVSDGSEQTHRPVGEDHFYQGVIAWVHWGHELGAVRSASGREIQFEFPFIRVLGEHRSVESLHAGMRVGFDVGQTSDGLRVTILKIYD